MAATGFAVAVASSPIAVNTKVSKRLLGKRADGSIAWWGMALFWPYHVGLQTKLWIYRQVATEPSYTCVAPGWYIGGWPGVPGGLPPGNPSVVDLTCELPRRSPGRYLCLPTWDNDAPTPLQIETGAQWAFKERGQGHPVFVHCAHGHGRSTVVLCACLVLVKAAASFQEAFAMTKKLRPGVKLNRKQYASLVEWDKMRFGNAKHS
ncbi:hypothetical protein WJX72_001063 [[Myrmecia] bisecta]|uniref:Tyrosine specific protein phosphatases domain-containing protein n=1 Tax=[Myrmecia] bisecta TaxID=41462 RepID=A0AAW1PK96_9CHLO